MVEQISGYYHQLASCNSRCTCQLLRRSLHTVCMYLSMQEMRRRKGKTLHQNSHMSLSWLCQNMYPGDTHWLEWIELLQTLFFQWCVFLSLLLQWLLRYPLYKSPINNFLIITNYPIGVNLYYRQFRSNMVGFINIHFSHGSWQALGQKSLGITLRKKQPQFKKEWL